MVVNLRPRLSAAASTSDNPMLDRILQSQGSDDAPAPTTSTPSPAPAAAPATGNPMLDSILGGGESAPAAPSISDEDQRAIDSIDAIADGTSRLLDQSNYDYSLLTGDFSANDETLNEELTSTLGLLSRAWYMASEEDNEEMRDMVSGVLSQLRPVIGEEQLTQYDLGEAMPDEEWLRRQTDSIVGGIGWALGGNPVGRAISEYVLQPLGEIGEGFALGLAEAGRAIGGDENASLWDAADSMGSGILNAGPGQIAGPNPLEGKYDTNGDGMTNFREILGFDAGAGGDSWLGLAVGAIDSVGLAVIDPTTYAGVGLVGRARAGVEAAERVGGRALAREVAENGLRNLDDAVVQSIEQELRKGLTDAAENGRRMTTRERLRRLDGLEDQLAATMDEISTASGRFRLGGRNIRTPIDTLAESNPLRRQYGDIAEAGNVLDTAASGVRRNIAQIFGEGVDEVTPTSNGVRVEGRILHRGRDIGNYTRQLLNDGTAIFDHSGIDEAFRGKGHATRFLDNQVEALADQGFHTIKMVAEGDGALVWGRRGFEFDVDHPQFQPSMQSLSRRLRMKADELESGVLDDVAEYDGDAQLDALANEGAGMFSGGNPDDLRMLADEIDIAMRNGMYDLLPDPSDARWANLAGVVDDTMGFPMVRYIDDAAEPGPLRSFLDDTDAGLNQRFDADVSRRGVTDFIPERFKRVLDPISPRRQIRRSGTRGDDVERIVDDARTEVEGLGAQRLDEMNAELTAAAKAAAEEFGAPSREIGTPNYTRRMQEGIAQADEFLRVALEGDEALARDVLQLSADELSSISPSQFAEMAADALDADDLPATANYLRTANRWREQMDEAASSAGLDDDRLRRFYMPRVLTRDGRKWLQDNADDLGAVENIGRPGTSLGEIGFQSERSGPTANMSVEQANATLAKALDLPDGMKLFDESVLASYATRGRSSFRAAAQADIFRGLQNEIVDGVPLMVVDDGSAAARAVGSRADYTSLRTPGGVVFTPKEVAQEFRQTMEALSDDQWVRGLTELRRNWSQIWGSYATSPLIDGIGFHSRNATGNLMLNALAGVVNPLDYTRALNLQRKFARAGRAVSSGKSTWDTVWDDIGVSEADRALIQGMQRENILGAGFFDDIAQGTSQRGAVYEFLGNNKMIRQGRALGNAVEDNARMAHYISKLEAPGGTPKSAARSVRKFLFDYSDLTDFERKLRHVSRFYTFMRKNTGVQLWALAHVPGRVAQIEQASQTALGGFNSGLGLMQPEYSQERGDTIVNALGLGGTVSGIETPFGAAMDPLLPLYEIANILPGVGELIPGESDETSLIRSLYELTSGGERAFVDAVYEALTQKDIFTGRDLDDEGAEQVAMKWIDALVGPAWSQLDRFVGRVTEGEGVGPLGNNLSESQADIGRELVVLSNILGLQVAPQGERQRLFNLYAINAELEEVLNGAPTLSDLRKAGEVPEAPDTPSRARSVTLREQITDLQEQGLPTAELEAQLAEQVAEEERLGYEIDPETGEFTSHEQRLKAFALGLGPEHTTEFGQGSTSTLTKVLWNEQNPDDPFLDDDGTPLDEYDVPVRWYEANKEDVLAWAQENRAPLSEAGKITRETQDAYNRANPDNPYYGKMSQVERAEAGLTPIQGVFVYTDDLGREREVRSSGLSALSDEPRRSPLSELLGD